MASMNKKIEEKQPSEKKLRIDILQEEGRHSSNPNESDLPKSAEGDKESTNLLSSHSRRKLPAELNHEIFYCFKLATRRKFILGLGWDFYAMFRQTLLKKSKRLCNPEENAYSRSNAEISISNGGLNCSKNTNRCQHIYAEKGFLVSGADCRKDDFPGTICYYFEVKILKSASWYVCEVGLADTEIPELPNFYVIGIPIPTGNFYRFFLSGQRIRVELPAGLIRPQLNETWNVVGCGILIDPDDKLTIFFTLNGIMIGRQFPIDPTVDNLIPTVRLQNDMFLEANFGHNHANPFEYDIKKCPGLGLEWI